MSTKDHNIARLIVWVGALSQVSLFLLEQVPESVRGTAAFRLGYADALRHMETTLAPTLGSEQELASPSSQSFLDTPHMTEKHDPDDL